MSKAKQLLSPRGYLSWTQISEWERNPNAYIKNYMLGEQTLINNAYMNKGKDFADSMESGEATGDEMTDLVASSLTKYDTPEKTIMATLATRNGQIKMLGKLDTFDSKAMAFREYKTGKIPWTQQRADKHGQLLHYSALIWLEYKKLPKSVFLDWAMTTKENDDVVFTGIIKTFEVKITMSKILEYLNRVAKVAVQIDKTYREQLKQTYDQF